jgi:hypothetical protein
MPHMGLADPIEAVVLYQLDNPAETSFHVSRQDIELFSNPVVQQFYDPRHLRALLHFCNSCRQLGPQAHGHSLTLAAPMRFQGRER